MRMRAMLSISALTATAALGLGASGASAATLFTTAAHTTEVTVGAPLSATLVTPFIWTSGTSVINSCSGGTLSGRVSRNSGGTVAGTFMSGTITSCSPNPLALTFTTPWTLTIAGTSVTTAATTVWSNARLTSFTFDLLGGVYTGTFTSGLSARQAHTSGPICIRFEDAGEFTGPLTGDGRLDTNFCLEGAAAAWHLTN